ncbi:UDP binding domain-containing protein [Paenibacillus sp. JCM 10914]|uniref:UDP binding domain-containing protein n=1 Tax=Paenibacillus sp. JCM 10914 TaxID=1236974 RepID=UPI000A40EC87|nr:UDP binding domain-containing protein [Paenibacillus sp. JCM 10914]
MPEWVIGKVSDALNKESKSLMNSKILVLGLSYKKDIDDVRESPSVELMELLKAKGAQIYYSDPYIPVFPKMRKHSFDLKSILITPELLQEIDCTIISTDHEVFDYDLIHAYSKLIVDTRGVYRSITSDKIVRA